MILEHFSRLFQCFMPCLLGYDFSRKCMDLFAVRVMYSQSQVKSHVYLKKENQKTKLKDHDIFLAIIQSMDTHDTSRSGMVPKWGPINQLIRARRSLADTSLWLVSSTYFLLDGSVRPMWTGLHSTIIRAMEFLYPLKCIFMCVEHSTSPSSLVTFGQWESCPFH